MKNEAVFIDNNTPKSIFPEKFTNNFYLSSVYLINNYDYSYKSNFSIKYTFKGKETYEINDDIIDLNTGQTLIVNQDSMTCPRFIQGDGISLFIEQKILNDIHQSVFFNPLESLNGTYEDRWVHFKDSPIFTSYLLKAQLNQCIQVYQRDRCLLMLEEDYYSIAEALFRDQNILSKQFANLKSIHDYKHKKDIFLKLDTAYDFLYNSLDQTPSLKELSQVAHISPFYLNRLFKEVYGLPPTKLLIYLKMEKAKELLRFRKDIMIKDIAFLLGYEALSAFSKQIKLLEGKGPRAYRKTST
ncbi:MAG: AraC family transcriptional regulator [Bacteroidota bacterium]